MAQKTGKGNGHRTEAQLAALAAGRAKRDRLRAEVKAGAKTKAPAKRTASRSPANRQPPSPAATGAPESPNPPTTSSDLPASSSVDADSLSVFFEDSPGGEQQPSSGGVLGALLGTGTSAAPSGHSAPSSKPDKREEEVAKATEDWQEVASQLFILLAAWVVADDLKPTEGEADKITRPLIRIVMRHYDPARQASNDVLDAVGAAVAMAYYLNRVGPEWRSRRAEQKVKILHGGGQPTAKPVRIDRGTPAGPTRMAAASAPAGNAGLRTDAVRSDPGSVLPRAESNGHAQSDYGLTAEAVVEEYLGLSL